MSPISSFALVSNRSSIAFPLVGLYFTWLKNLPSWIAYNSLCYFSSRCQGGFSPPAGWVPPVMTSSVAEGRSVHQQCLFDQAACRRYLLKGSLCCLSLLFSPIGFQLAHGHSSRKTLHTFFLPCCRGQHVLPSFLTCPFWVSFSNQ